MANHIIEQIERVGGQLLAAYDDSTRIVCPVCGFQNFELHRISKHIVFECLTPIPHECEEGGPFCVAPCGFRYVVDPIPAFRLPKMQVAPEKRPAAAKKPARPRRKRNDTR